MRTPFLLCLVVVVMTCTAPLSAQALSIASVDMQRVMAEAKAAKSAKSQLEAKQKEFQADVSRIENDLQKQDQELAKQRSLLSADAFKTKLEEFRTKATAAQKDVQSKRVRLRRAFEMSIVTIQKKVTEIIASIAQEKGYDLVIPQAQAIYAKPELDITEEVLGKLDSALPSMKVDFGS